MKKVGFIGSFDKINLILYLAKLFTLNDKKVLIVDATVLQKAKYIVPTISPTISYITEFEEIDVAVGFQNMTEINQYLAGNNEAELGYDYILFDIDSGEALENFEIQTMDKNYFVTSFSTFDIRRGLDAISNIREPIKLTKVLFSKEILNSEDEYLGYLSLGYKVIWDEYNIYFPLEQGDQTAIMENERVSKIKFGNLSSQYRESLMFMAEELLENVSGSHIRKIVKNIE